MLGGFLRQWVKGKIDDNGSEVWEVDGRWSLLGTRWCFFLLIRLIRTQGKSIARIDKVVPSPNESDSRDSNMCSYPYGL